jgi:ABC-type glycerol-3-phosphate transport system permease component
MIDTTSSARQTPAISVGSEVGGVSKNYQARVWRRRLGTLGKHLLVGGVGVIFAFPVIWMVLISVRTDAEIFEFPPRIFPHHWAFSNYVDAFNYIPYLLYTYNTFVICFLNVVGTLFSCTLVAYGLARVHWHGRNAMLLLVLSTMLLPYPVTLIPLYVIFKDLGMLGTFAPLIVPSFFGSAFFIFLLRQFFMSIPHELDESARIDGANHLIIFLRIILPLARPALAVVALLTFLNNWTDFFGPSIYLTNTNLYTLSLGLQEYRGLHLFHWSSLMAASVLFMLPVVVLFALAQRTFIQGIAMTGLKG